MGFAGDFTYNSIRSTVKVYRDSAGVREIGILDFNKKNVLNSSYFYLKRNDVIVVDTDVRLRQTVDAYSRATMVVSVLSGLVAVFAILKK